MYCRRLFSAISLVKRSLSAKIASTWEFRVLMFEAYFKKKFSKSVLQLVFWIRSTVESLLRFKIEQFFWQSKYLTRHDNYELLANLSF